MNKDIRTHGNLRLLQMLKLSTIVWYTFRMYLEFSFSLFFNYGCLRKIQFPNLIVALLILTGEAIIARA
jgi:hypothetical protein